jgi:hypothetical protein
MFMRTTSVGKLNTKIVFVVLLEALIPCNGGALPLVLLGDGENVRILDRHVAR